MPGSLFRAFRSEPAGRKIANQNYPDKPACSICSIIDFLQHLRYTPSQKVFPLNFCECRYDPCATVLCSLVTAPWSRLHSSRRKLKTEPQRICCAIQNGRWEGEDRNDHSGLGAKPNSTAEAAIVFCTGCYTLSFDNYEKND